MINCYGGNKMGVLLGLRKRHFWGRTISPEIVVLSVLLVFVPMCAPAQTSPSAPSPAGNSDRLPITTSSPDAARLFEEGSRDLIVVLSDPTSLEMCIVAQKLLLLRHDEFKTLIDVTNQSRMTFWVVSGDDDVLKIVRSDTSAIGLVNVYSINSNVEVLKIDGKLPLEPGYVLHSQ